MDAICRDDDNQDFRLKPEDFLARGLGNDGKGDYQGCGEFNPLMIFSKDEQAFFDKEANHNARNKENLGNGGPVRRFFCGSPEAVGGCGQFSISGLDGGSVVS